jgi:hypothetical protein
MIKRLASLTHHASLRGFLVLVLLSGLLVAANWSRRPAAPHRTASEYIEPADDVDNENESASDESEHRKAREEWFRLQRAYPFDQIPAEGRLKAWKTRPREKFQVQAEGSLWQSIGPTPISSAPLNNWGLTSGRITALAVSPADSQIVLFGGAEGELCPRH